MPPDPKRLIVDFGRKYKAHPRLKFITANEEELRIRNLTEGLLNMTLLIQSPDCLDSVIIKYGEEKSLTSLDFKVTLERQSLEYNCLKVIHRLCPGAVPEPYVYDKEMQIIAIEYLENAKVLGPELCRGDINLSLAAEIGRILGRFHFQTHRKVVNEETWTDFKRSLRNEEILEEFHVMYRFKVFENSIEKCAILYQPYITLIGKLMSEIKAEGIFDTIKELYRHEDCLIHYDLHHFSVMFSEGRTALIDFELGGLGHHSLSLGFLLAFYYMGSLDIRNKLRTNKEELHALTMKAMGIIVDTFLKEFGDRVEILGPQATFISSLVGILGHILFIFPSYVTFSNFVQTDDRRRTEVLKKGHHLMAHHKTISSMDELFQTLFSEDSMLGH